MPDKREKKSNQYNKNEAPVNAHIPDNGHLLVQQNSWIN
jgi:hypothetical protein